LPAVVHFPLRRWLPAAAAAVCIFAHAAAPAADARVDEIERTNGAGDFPTALRLSADLLARTGERDAARGDALLARMDVLIDSGQWSALSGALPTAIAAIPGTAMRDALQACFAADEAINAANQKALIDIAETQLARADGKALAWFGAEMHGARAKAALALGKLDVAQAEAQVALDTWHAQPAPRARRQEITMNLVLAQAAQQQGKSDVALERAGVASAIAVAAFGPASPAQIRAADQRAIALEALDRFPEARELREATLKVTREHYGARHLRTALAEGALGAHLQRTGNYAPAREHYAIAESIINSGSDASARERLVLANNYANLLQEMGDEDAALARYRTAFGLVADDRTRAIILTNIGNTEFRLRRYEAAIADFEQALPLRERAEGDDSPGLSFALEGLGSSALVLRRFADAEKYFTRAAALRAKASAPNHSQLNVLNFGLALAHWGQGHEAEAFRLAVQTAQQQQSLLGSLATGFSEQQSVAFDSLLVPATPLAVTIAAAHGDAAEVATAWRLVMIERGLIARAEARRLAIARASVEPGLAPLYRDWRNANSALGDGWTSSRTTAAAMHELQSAAEAAERALWTRLGYQQDDPAGAARAPEELSRALPKDGVLIAFTQGVARDAARIVNAGVPQTAEDLYAFVLRAGAAPSLLRIGGVAAVSGQVHGWYSLLRDPHSDPAQLLRRGADLRDELLGHVDGIDAGKTLFVIPTGELFRVSFAALPDPHGDGYWIETGLRVHTLAHENDLLTPAQPGGVSRVLLAGAPQFGALRQDRVSGGAARLLCAHAAEQGFVAIPGAARELAGLRDLLRGTLAAGSEVRVIDGAQATKERVLAALDGTEVVHLATHGFSFDETCGSDNARGMTLERAVTAGPTAGPALSGLAFAGADVSGGRTPVGVLSAAELSAADLTHAAWVVLSACDSGLGPIGRSEGVFGMRRALRLAGARSVVMSLWEADDVATADLMQSLYKARFGERRNVPEAMAQAMRETIAARRAAHASTHPYYWAAFVGEGAWH